MAVKSIVSGLYALQLPSYTSERYYLLSELENASIFTFLEEEPQPFPNKSKEPFVVCYILWDMRAADAVAELEIKVNKLIAHSFLNSRQNKKQCLVVIEAMHTNFTTKCHGISVADESIRTSLEEALVRLNQQLSPGLVCFAVSNNVAGTAGLDVCLDFCNTVTASSISSSGHNDRPPVEVICIDRISCLGHDPDREPDAIGEVEQQLFLSQDTDIISWTKSIVLERHQTDLRMSNGPLQSTKTQTDLRLPVGHSLLIYSSIVAIVLVAILARAILN